MQTSNMYFFTASILNWIPILFNDNLKKIILVSLKFLVTQKAMKLYAYVIMPNHIHLILKPLENTQCKNLQLSLMRYTAQQIKFFLQKNNPSILKKFYVNKKDRKYQIWQRNPLAIELYSRKVIEQKLDYIHNNPVQSKWMLSDSSYDYEYSSIKFYEGDEKLIPFLTHYLEEY